MTDGFDSRLQEEFKEVESAVRKFGVLFGVAFQRMVEAMMQLSRITAAVSETLNDHRFVRQMKKMRRREIYLRKYRRRGLKMSRRK